jgi:hypothetical protein
LATLSQQLRHLVEQFKLDSGKPGKKAASTASRSSAHDHAAAGNFSERPTEEEVLVR